MSYLPTLLGHSKHQKKHKFLYWEFPGYSGKQAVRMGRWKGIRNHMQKGNMNIQLFNLDNDMQEQHNVASQHPDIVQKIKHIMATEHTVPEVDHFKLKALEKKRK
jgi:arylsulfatase